MTATILDYNNLSPWVEILLVAYGLAWAFVRGRLAFYRWRGRKLRERLEAD
jgi:hypothetical protein